MGQAHRISSLREGWGGELTVAQSWPKRRLRTLVWSQMGSASLAHPCSYQWTVATSLRTNCPVMQDEYEGDIMRQGEDRAGQRIHLFVLLFTNKNSFLQMGLDLLTGFYHSCRGGLGSFCLFTYGGGGQSCDYSQKRKPAGAIFGSHTETGLFCSFTSCTPSLTEKFRAEF